MHSLNVIIAEPRKLILEKQPVPDPGPGEILVRSHQSLISPGTELNALLQRYTPDSYQASWMKYPFTPGYANVGTVLAVGPGVTAFAPGDRVASRARHQQYAIADVARAARIPDNIPDEHAAFHAIACIVQNGIRAARQDLGDAVAVVGLGLLGQLAVQYARVAGARAIVAVDPVESRRALALAHGATHAADSIDNARPVLHDVTAARMADVVYEVTGHPAALAPACSLLRRLGTLQLLGTTGDTRQQHLPGDFVARGLRIVAAHDTTPPAAATDHAYWTHPHMAAYFFTLLSRGSMRVADLVTHRFPATEAPRAYDLLINSPQNAMGVIFDWTALA